MKSGSSKVSSKLKGLVKGSALDKSQSSVTSLIELEAVPSIPNSRLDKEAYVTATSSLGSSQIVGCQGDFCGLNLISVETSETHAPLSKKHKTLSDFRRKLMTADAGNVDYFDSSTHKMPDITGKLSATSFSEPGQEESNGGEFKKIALRSVIQARQEMSLVKLQLDRHKRGDKSPYVTEDTYQGLSISRQMPAHYYQQVPVCSTCYKVYNIVDTARAKALKAITKKNDERKSFDDLQSIGNSTLETRSNIFPKGSLSRYSDAGSFLNDSSMLTVESAMDKNAQDTLRPALEAIDGLTKLDVAEIRTMSKPPAAVEVVMEAVMILLTGKAMPFREVHKLLGGGEAFLSMLREFDLRQITEARLELIESYVDNPLFRPENVQPISFCASKFCAWVHGIVQAARWERGISHKRIDVLKPKAEKVSDKFPILGRGRDREIKPVRKGNPAVIGRNSGAHAQAASDELTFVQKLQNIKENKMKEGSGPPPIGRGGSLARNNTVNQRSNQSLRSISRSADHPIKGSKQLTQMEEQGVDGLLSRSSHRFDPGPTPNFSQTSQHDDDGLSKSTKKISKRDAKVVKASQKKATERLSAQSAAEGSAGIIGNPKDFRCSDGITKIPYIVLGKFSLDNVSRCSFVVIHDFFDTCDATAILFKNIAQRHEGSQIFCFNYPGQANTVWPRLSVAEKECGAKEVLLNNDWIADRIHEVLQHAEQVGDLLLSCPFHLVGIGNGAAIAGSFVQKYGYHPNYVGSLRSVVSVNGFLYPDPQLSSVLHSAYQVFESTPHNRPDIPVSYWCRYVFSDDYLTRINPNLALNIYTAVSNPITNEGRTKIAKGALQHRDLRGALAPDYAPNKATRAVIESDGPFRPIQVPVVILQSTENSLVNASNVDSFLIGRHSKHLWSHMLNIPSESMMSYAFDVNAQWVGKMSTSPQDYHRYSTLGKHGLRMLLDSLQNPRGAFSMWTRCGHAVQQEFKGAILDLMDVLACPTDEYTGLDILDEQSVVSGITSTQLLVPTENEELSSLIENKPPPKVGVLFRLQPPNNSRPLAKPEVDAEQKKKKNEEESRIDEIVEHDVAAPSPRPPGPMITAISEQSIEMESLCFSNDISGIHEIPDVSMESVEPWREESSVLDSPVQQEIFNLDQTIEPQPNEVSNEVSTNASVDQKTSPFKEESNSSPIQKSHEQLQKVNKPIILPPSQPRPVLPAFQLLDSALPEFRAEPMRERAQPQPLAIKDIVEGKEIIVLASENQQKQKEWTRLVPDVATALDLEAELEKKKQEYLELEAKIKERALKEEQNRLERIEKAQEERRETFHKEDEVMLAALQAELDARQKERDFAEKQRRLQTQEIEKTLIKEGILEASDLSDPYDVSDPHPVLEMQPVRYDEPDELPSIYREGRDMVSQLDRMLMDEEDARKKGTMSMEEFEKVKARIAERQMERDALLRHLSDEEKERLCNRNAIRIQKRIRGILGRIKAHKAAVLRQERIEKEAKALRIQAVARGMFGRRRFAEHKRIFLLKLKGEHSAVMIQKIMRAYLGRKYFRRVQRWKCANKIQKTFRGYLGVLAFKREKARIDLLKKKQRCASKIQSVWRMKVAKEEFRSLRIHMLAAIEIQRVYRGYNGRKTMARRRQWESAAPGPERIKLGLQFIEESKVAFERQQEEIDALHHAQERAEARISHIHSELKESEKELVVLERELQEIDQIERDLTNLTHERGLLVDGIEDATGIPRTAANGHHDLVMGKESNRNNDPLADRRRRAEAYALEMTIQIKRAEREKKRQELEIEFAAVFQQVEKKKKALERLELSLSEMEATRERKDREFRRLQKNLMQLLLEQKTELDELREKGIELETASATTAAAAVATAQKAKEHEERSSAMFSQTEELMKFQFMSMSLSYFSSLNMLKSLRDMNADTTSAAIALSADASATAASAASAANLPNFKKLNLGASDFIEGSIQKKKAAVEVKYMISAIL